MIIWNSEQQVSANFKMSEFYSKSPDAPYAHELDDRLITACQAIRDWAGVPVRITSTYRTKSHNDSLTGSSSKSQHLFGKAVDLQFTEDNGNWIRELQRQVKYDGQLAEDLQQIGITTFGYYDTFAHLDVRENYPNGQPIEVGDMHTFGSLTSSSGVGEDGVGAVVSGNWKNLTLVGVCMLMLGSRWM